MIQGLATEAQRSRFLTFQFHQLLDKQVLTELIYIQEILIRNRYDNISRTLQTFATAEYTAVTNLPHSTLCSISTLRPPILTLCLGVT